MRFSLLLCVYNAQDYLNRSIDAILAQGVRDFELLCVDDGSTDQSGRILDSYAEQDKRVRVFHTENRGVFLARAFAESHARGEYLLHLDADDTISAQLLESLSEAIDKTKPDVCFYDFQVRVAGQEKSEVFFDRSRVFEGEALQEIYKLLFSTRFNCLWNKCFHRSLISSAPDYTAFHGLRHGEDLLRTSYLVFGARRISYIHTPLYTYTLGIGNAAKFDADSLKSYDSIFADLEKLLYQNTKRSEEWNTITHDLCRKQLDNYLSLLSRSDTAFKESASLLRKGSETTIWKNALLVAPQSFKYKLLRKRRYRLFLLFSKVRRWMRAQ